MTEFDFSSASTAIAITDLPVGIPNVRLEEWATGTLIVRVHALAVSATATALTFSLKAVAPSDEAPGTFFRGPTVATARFTALETKSAPLASRGNYDGGGGAACSLFMSVCSARSGTCSFKVSVDLVVRRVKEPWTPARLGSLKLWLDQRDLVQVAGSYLSWGDQSAAGTNDFGQAITILQPTLFTSPPTNQWPAPSFNGSTQYLEGPAIGSFMSASAYHVFAVFNARSMSGNNALITRNNGVLGDIQSWWGLYLRTGGEVHGVHEDASGVRDAFVAMPLSTTSIVEWSFDGVHLGIRANDGAPAVVVTPGLPVANVGNGCRIGNASLSGLFLDGRVASIIVCNEHLSSDESQATRAYLSSKYGVPV